jgi:hypothetical protein
MKMSFESWVKNSWLERLQSDAKEVARLLALADGRLADYEKAVTAKLSPDAQLGPGIRRLRANQGPNRFGR